MKIVKNMELFFLAFICHQGLIGTNTGDKVLNHLQKTLPTSNYDLLRTIDSIATITMVSHQTGKQITVLEQAIQTKQLSWFVPQLFSYHHSNTTVMQKLVDLALSFKNEETGFIFFQQLNKHATPTQQKNYLKNSSTKKEKVNQNLLIKLNALPYLAPTIQEKYKIKI